MPGAALTNRLLTVSIGVAHQSEEDVPGAGYDTLLSVTRAAEELDFDTFFRSDHYLAMCDASGMPGPTDARITPAGLGHSLLDAAPGGFS